MRFASRSVRARVLAASSIGLAILLAGACELNSPLLAEISRVVKDGFIASVQSVSLDVSSFDTTGEQGTIDLLWGPPAPSESQTAPSSYAVVLKLGSRPSSPTDGTVIGGFTATGGSLEVVNPAIADTDYWVGIWQYDAAGYERSPVYAGVRISRSEFLADEAGYVYDNGGTKEKDFGYSYFYTGNVDLSRPFCKALLSFPIDLTGTLLGGKLHIFIQFQFPATQNIYIAWVREVWNGASSPAFLYDIITDGSPLTYSSSSTGAVDIGLDAKLAEYAADPTNNHGLMMTSDGGSTGDLVEIYSDGYLDEPKLIVFTAAAL